MNFYSFLSVFSGFFLMGVSVGYVVGFYVAEYSPYKSLFYLSVLLMGIGVFLLIYGSLFRAKNGNKKKYNK